ncbi:MAG TPA: VOC family protein [Rhizobiaceae bacterium]
MIVGFNHTSFTVANLERAVDFWTKLGFVGSGIVDRNAEWVAGVTGVPGARIRVVHLHGYGHHMEFIEYAGANRDNPTAPPNVPGVGHVCLDVEDIHATFAELLAAGASPLGRMTEIDHPDMTPCAAGYLRDPNGVIIELLEKR